MENDIAHASATYPERSLYYRDEVKAAIDASLSRQAHEADAVKDAVNEALEHAAKVASAMIADSDIYLYRPHYQEELPNAIRALKLG